MKRKLWQVGVWSLWTAAVVVASAGTAQATEGVVILFDRSASMGEVLDGNCAPPGETGPFTRGNCGLFNLGDSRWTNLFGSGSLADHEVFFWEFQSPGGTEIIINDDTSDRSALGGFDNHVPGIGNVTPTFVMRQGTDVLTVIASARTAFNKHPDNRSGTPLAQAFCRAVAHLMNPPTGTSYTSRRIVLVSDGAQGPTLPDNQMTDCQGPDALSLHSFPLPAPLSSGGRPGYRPKLESTTWFVTTQGLPQNSNPDNIMMTAGSWQANMLDVAMSAGMPGSGSGSVGLPNRRPFTLTELGQNCDPITGVCTGQPTGAVSSPFTYPAGSITSFVQTDASFLGDTTTPETQAFAFFLDGMTRSTGGRMLVVGAGPGQPFGTHIIAGDVNDNGCVDGTDFNLLKTSFGLPATPGTAALAADVNADGKVNDGDYLVMKAKYGTGCATSPGAIPRLGKVLFGMGDIANWVAGTNSPPIVASASHTEGTRGINVGNTGYREIKTVPFNTALFTEVTPANKTKLAVDLFIPPNPVNPFWLGQIQLIIDSPSAGINNQWIANVELTGKTPGQFATNLQFVLPTNVRNAINTSHSDFVIKLVINSSDTGHVFDNIVFL